MTRPCHSHDGLHVSVKGFPNIVKRIGHETYKLQVPGSSRVQLFSTLERAVAEDAKRSALVVPSQRQTRERLRQAAAAKPAFTPTHLLPNVKQKKCCRKGIWSEQEKQALDAAYAAESKGGLGNEDVAKDLWKRVARRIPGRSVKQCRVRWTEYHNPKVNRERFTTEERRRLEELLLIYGTRWTKIAKFFPGRTDHQVKNAMARFANHLVFLKCKSAIIQSVENTPCNMEEMVHDSGFTDAFLSEFDEHVGNRGEYLNSQGYVNVTILKRVGAGGEEVPAPSAGLKLARYVNSDARTMAYERASAFSSNAALRTVLPGSLAEGLARPGFHFKFTDRPARKVANAVEIKAISSSELQQSAMLDFMPVVKACNSSTARTSDVGFECCETLHH